MDDKNVSQDIHNQVDIDTLGLDEDDNNSEVRTIGYEAYLKAQGIVLEPGNEFESMVGL